MFKFIAIGLPIAALVLLLVATLVLGYYNFNSKTFGLLLTGLFVGTATAFVTIFPSLKPKVIERSFLTSVIIDESTHLPIFVSGMTKQEQRLSKLMFWGNPQRPDESGSSITSIRLPQNVDESLSYSAGLIQYAIFKTVQEIHLKTEGISIQTQPSGAVMSTTIHRPVIPPAKEKFGKKDFEEILKKTPFANSDTEDQAWELIPTILPTKTTVSFSHVGSTPENGVETFKMFMRKPNFFDIEFSIRPHGATGQGVLPNSLAIPGDRAKNGRVYSVLVEMRADLPALTSQNPQRENYEKWIEWMFSEIEERLSA